MSVLQDVDTALSVAFVVKLDDQSLGAFTSCEGLGCEVVLESREEGGNNGFVWQLPTKLKYPNIKLSRPLGRETETIAKWFASMATGYTRGATGTIEAMTAGGRVIATWGLIDVVPVRWTGPSMSADSPKVLTETVEIAHHGFLVAAPAAGPRPGTN
ncbi:phage tail protein [Knoellia aerolata]|uniref:phage tail protein n=1 Tax=Knoellia aerolata TaxID=442954 RepID=UPI00068F37A3|nr:phage tail protein [Knoellia aerolata]